jgi:hypothetical protein
MLVLVAGPALGACSAPSSPAPATSAGGQGSSTTTTSTTAAPTAAKPCPAGSLAGTVVGSSGAAGTIEVTIALRNTSTAACTLAGYPGLQLLDASGAQLPTHVVRGGTYPFTGAAPSLVTMAPGGPAYVNLGYSDVPSGSATSCPEAVSMWVTPPGAYDHLTVTVTLAPCAGGTVATSPAFGPGSPATQTTAP